MQNVHEKVSIGCSNETVNIAFVGGNEAVVGIFSRLPLLTEHILVPSLVCAELGAQVNFKISPTW